MKKMTGTILSFAAIVAGLFFYTACEVSSTDDPRGISVSPTTAKLAPDQTVVLTAKGGWGYKWTLSDDTLGYFSTAHGPQAIYVAKDGRGTQVITVTANGSEPVSSSSSTNSTTTTTSSSATVHVLQGI